MTMAVLGCSNGAEVYSILATIRSGQPSLKVTLHAVDISKDILNVARQAAYSSRSPELVGAPIFERLADAEIPEMFHRDGDTLRVQSWITRGIVWHLGDAGDPGMIQELGLQDLVVANNFLCHMKPVDADTCLRQLARLVKPGGHLVVSGIDLDVRTRVATDLGWTPVTDLLEEIHDGDSAVRRDWPWAYWGLEPLDKNRRDWTVRYASAFQLMSNDLRGAGTIRWAE
jgi:SAM-dependent methyltransferase